MIRARALRERRANRALGGNLLLAPIARIAFTTLVPAFVHGS